MASASGKGKPAVDVSHVLSMTNNALKCGKQGMTARNCISFGGWSNHTIPRRRVCVERA